METKVLNYRVIITPEKLNGKTVYNAISPTLGVADWGNSIEKALEHIKGALKCHIESLLKNNEPIPKTELTAIRKPKTILQFLSILAQFPQELSGLLFAKQA